MTSSFSSSALNKEYHGKLFYSKSFLLKIKQSKLKRYSIRDLLYLRTVCAGANSNNNNNNGCGGVDAATIEQFNKIIISSYSYPNSKYFKKSSQKGFKPSRKPTKCSEPNLANRYQDLKPFDFGNDDSVPLEPLEQLVDVDQMVFCNLESDIIVDQDSFPAPKSRFGGKFFKLDNSTNPNPTDSTCNTSHPSVSDTSLPVHDLLSLLRYPPSNGSSNSTSTANVVSRSNSDLAKERARDILKSLIMNNDSSTDRKSTPNTTNVTATNFDLNKWVASLDNSSFS